MSFNHWVFSKASSAEAGLTASGIIGTFGLDLYTTSAGLARVIAGYVVTPTFTRGSLRGRVSSLLRIKSNTSSLFYAGVYCMASSLTTVSDGTLYVIQVAKGTTNNVQLRKAAANGIQGTGATGTQIGSSTSANFTNNGDTISLEFEWDASNQIGIGGTYLKASIGTATDFSNLAPFVETVDSSSPLTTTVAEGMFIYQNHVTGFPTSIVFDQTSIYTEA